MSRASQHPANRRGILKAAAKLFAARGYDDVSVREIVEAAGVTKPVLYYYFKHKEGVARALIEDFLGAADQVRARVFAAPTDVKTLLVDYTAEMLRLARSHRETLAFSFSIWFGRSSLKELIRHTEEYDCKVHAEWIETLTRRGLSPGASVRLVLTYWSMLLHELLKVAQFPKAPDIACLSQEMSHLALYGALSEPPVVSCVPASPAPRTSPRQTGKQNSTQTRTLS